MSRRRMVVISAAGVVTLGVAFGLYWFQPWMLSRPTRQRSAARLEKDR